MLQVNIFKGTEAELKRRLLKVTKARGLPTTYYLHRTQQPGLVLWTRYPLDTQTLFALNIEATCHHFINPFLSAV